MFDKINPKLVLESRKVFQQVENELVSARMKYTPFNSTHEGYAVIAEELDELWELIKKNKGYEINDPQMIKECVQLAAMAVAFIVDLSKKRGGK